MCTALSCLAGDHYFGRNLDLEYAFKECIAVTPRNYPFRFRATETIETHYAMIGMATIANNYPLYYEATNEKGLSIAGLNFPGLAKYRPIEANKDNIAPFELIPWILGQCDSVEKASDLLERINIADIAFSKDYPLSPLHWLIADAEKAIVLESTVEGLTIYDNPIGVLTNNPPFSWHMYHLSNYLQLSSQQAGNNFAPDETILPYSNGMGAIGLPGDFSSSSRFIRASFVKLNAVFEGGEGQKVSQFLHILNSVAMPRGSVKMPDGRNEITLYSCCCNTTKGIYYYNAYNNSTISAVDMHREDLDGNNVSTYPMINSPDIRQLN